MHVFTRDSQRILLRLIDNNCEISLDMSGLPLYDRGCGHKGGQAPLRGISPAYLVLNPPYGRRLEGGGESFYRDLGRHIQRNFHGWQTLVLFPGNAELKAFGLHATRLLRPRHGGL
ncbi:MAG: hypothetical protein LBK44_04595, partial [Spirochaetales bacterium]|nr:hypothetical protein [Spirochaetales bacterium]